MKKEQLMDFMKRKGTFLALILCVVGVVTASFAAVSGLITPKESEKQPMQPPLKRQEELPWQQEELPELTGPVEKKQTEVPKEPSILSEQQKSDASSGLSGQGCEKQQDVSASPQPSAAAYGLPVPGECIQPFSGEELVFNETMQDWRTHNGTDYRASYETEVSSICAGTVESVEQDVLWGTVVTVRGKDELLVRYCGLQKKTDVRVGDAVEVGSRIGRIGECSAEIAMEPHLHLEVMKDGVLQDPQLLLTK